MDKTTDPIDPIMVGSLGYPSPAQAEKARAVMQDGIDKTRKLCESTGIDQLEALNELQGQLDRCDAATSYQAWADLSARLLSVHDSVMRAYAAANEQQPCPRCEGKGSMLALTSTNGQQDTQDCDICRGVGTIPAGEYDEAVRRMNESSLD